MASVNTQHEVSSPRKVSWDGISAYVFGSTDNVHPTVSVICPTYNSEEKVVRALDSIFSQTLAQGEIETIVIDDGSTDGTTSIVKTFQQKHPNLKLAILDHNTGSPSIPRNMGIQLAHGSYLYFLDSDDWLHPEGLTRLLDILQETGDDYVVGKTIEVNDKGRRVHGRFTCYDDLRSIDPFDAPGLLRYLGPQSRMVKASLVKDNEIKFPQTPYSEDKAFFMQVLAMARHVSMTTQIIQYLDRTTGEKKSLSKSNNILSRRKCDLGLIARVKALKLPANHEAVLLNRIYEHDFLHMFTTRLFIKTLRKYAFSKTLVRSARNGTLFETLRHPLTKRTFLKTFGKAYKTTKDLRYDFADNLRTPLYRLAVKLYRDGRTDDFIRLFSWHETEDEKRRCLRNGAYCYEIPFLEGEERFLPIPLVAQTEDVKTGSDGFLCRMQLLGPASATVNRIVLRDRKRVGAERKLGVILNLTDQSCVFTLPLPQLAALDPSEYLVLIGHSEYELLSPKGEAPEVHANFGGSELCLGSGTSGKLELTVRRATQAPRV